MPKKKISVIDFWTLANDEITKAIEKRTDESKKLCRHPRILFMTKCGTTSDEYIDLYNAGQRHFGLCLRQTRVDRTLLVDPMITAFCPDIKWHIIGTIPAYKASRVVDIPNLYMIESINSIDLAAAFENCYSKLKKREPLKVYVNVHCDVKEIEYETDSYIGARSEDVLEVVGFILNRCPNLKFCGIKKVIGTKEQYQILIQHRKEICRVFSLDINDVELSMGVFSDCEYSLEHGSVSIQVGPFDRKIEERIRENGCLYEEREYFT